MDSSSLEEDAVRRLAKDLVENPMVKPTLWERLCGRLNGKTTLRHELVLSRLRERFFRSQRTPAERSLAAPFLLRVDDFPQPEYSLQQFRRFHEIPARYGIRYLLGVTPFLHATPMAPGDGLGSGLDPEEVRVLQRIAQEADFALHGFSHRTIDIDPPSELAGLSCEALEDLIHKSLEVFRSLDIECSVFIPPFNTVPLEQVSVLARHFKILCGGPESLHYLGFRLSPSLLDGLVYLPSYPPAYAHAREVLEFVRQLKFEDVPVIVPLTLHWAWEVEDDFHSVDRLCAEIASRTVSVRDLLSDPSGVASQGKRRT